MNNVTQLFLAMLSGSLSFIGISFILEAIGIHFFNLIKSLPWWCGILFFLIAIEATFFAFRPEKNETIA